MPNLRRLVLGSVVASSLLSPLPSYGAFRMTGSTTRQTPREKREYKNWKSRGHKFTVADQERLIDLFLKKALPDGYVLKPAIKAGREAGKRQRKLNRGGGTATTGSVHRAGKKYSDENRIEYFQLVIKYLRKQDERTKGK